MSKNKKFNEVYSSFELFEMDAELYLSQGFITSAELLLLYNVLYMKFFNQSIAFKSVDTFKVRFWLKLALRCRDVLQRVKVMDEIRTMEMNELLSRGTSISNVSATPNEEGVEPYQEFNFVTTQQRTKGFNPKIVALMTQFQSLDNTYWDDFLYQFDRDLFMQIFTNSYYAILFEGDE